MPDDTTPPAPPAPAPVTPAAPVSDPNAAVVAATSEAFEHMKRALAEQDRKLAEALASRTQDPIAAQLAEYVERDKRTHRLETIRRMGVTSNLSDEQVLLLAPQVDAKDPAGVAALEAWRQANATLFTASGPTPESVVEATRQDLGDVQKKLGGLFSADKLIRSMLGGK